MLVASSMFKDDCQQWNMMQIMNPLISFPMNYDPFLSKIYSC